MSKTFTNPNGLTITLPDDPKCGICQKPLDPGKELVLGLLSLGSSPVPSLCCTKCFSIAQNAFSLIKGIGEILQPIFPRCLECKRELKGPGPSRPYCSFICQSRAEKKGKKS